jgi:hypothetical protein
MITQGDLHYKYSWSHYGNDNPKVSGPPDNTELNRNEGYEMLYFINKCAESWGWSALNKSSCQNLEKIIKEKVPTNIRTQGGIKEWITQNYKEI